MRPCRLKARHVGKRACKAREEQGRLANSEVGSAVKGPLQQGGTLPGKPCFLLTQPGLGSTKSPLQMHVEDVEDTEMHPKNIFSEQSHNLFQTNELFFS